jgi:methylase of polypeptide subunit release factors
MKRNEKHLDILKKIIKELEDKKKSNDYQLLVIKEEYEKTLKEIQNRNLEYLKKQGLIK